jgi:D-alanine-D-alanine ligase
MRICVLQSGAPAGSTFDGIDPECSPEPYLPNHEVTNVILEKATVASQLTALSKQGFDVFVNLCDGAWDEAGGGGGLLANNGSNAERTCPHDLPSGRRADAARSRERAFYSILPRLGLSAPTSFFSFVVHST